MNRGAYLGIGLLFTVFGIILLINSTGSYNPFSNSISLSPGLGSGTENLKDALLGIPLFAIGIFLFTKFRKPKKGQAAMEFLMTYGWAILAAIIAIGVLAYFGVFSPDRLSVDAAIITAPYSIQSFNLESFESATDLINLEILQNSGSSTTAASGSIIFTGAGHDSVITCTNEDLIKFNSGQLTLVSLNCGTAVINEGDRIKGELKIIYTSRSSLTQVSSGQLTATAITGSGSGSTCGDGTPDPGEECDDGNMNDNDDCTNACTNAICGDGIIWNQGIGSEECDGSDFGPSTCETEDFDQGSLTCANCAIDTSTCSFPEYKVFVTSTSNHDGNFGGISEADSECNTLASALGGNWLAWMSDSANNASTRLHHSTVPYKLLDGTTVATDWNQLIDGTIDAPINIDENSMGGIIDNIWTGTDFNGTATMDNCADWTDPGFIPATSGEADQTDSTWTIDISPDFCFNFARIYCFQQP